MIEKITEMTMHPGTIGSNMWGGCLNSSELLDTLEDTFHHEDWHAIAQVSYNGTYHYTSYSLETNTNSKGVGWGEAEG